MALPRLLGSDGADDDYRAAPFASGTVNSNVPRTATDAEWWPFAAIGRAEWWPFAAIGRMATGKVHAHQDRLAIPSAVAWSSHRRRRRHDHARAGIVEGTLGDPGKARIAGIVNVKARTWLADPMNGDALALWHHEASYAAIGPAKAVLAGQEAPAPGRTAQAAAALPLRPCNDPEALRAARSPMPLAGEAARWAAAGWHCRAHPAGRRHRMWSMPAAPYSGSCARMAALNGPGANRKLVNVVAGAGGHELILSDCGGWPSVACVACRAWAAWWCSLLAGQCRGQCTKAGMHALKRPAKGRHPVSQLSLLNSREFVEGCALAAPKFTSGRTRPTGRAQAGR